MMGVAMNLDKLFEWITVIVVGCAVTGDLNKLTHWIYHAQASLVYESRASSWGSPSIFKSTNVKESGSLLGNKK